MAVALRLPLGSLAALYLFSRIHGSAALTGPAVADGFVVAAVVKAIVVSNFFGRSYVADSLDPHMAIFFFCLAIWVATVVDEHGHGVAIDYDIPLAKSKQVGDGRLVVRLVSLLFGELMAGVFNYVSTFADGCCGVASGGMNGRGANDESHGMCDAFLWRKIVLKTRHES